MLAHFCFHSHITTAAVGMPSCGHMVHTLWAKPTHQEHEEASACVYQQNPAATRTLFPLQKSFAYLPVGYWHRSNSSISSGSSSDDAAATSGASHKSSHGLQTPQQEGANAERLMHVAESFFQTLKTSIPQACSQDYQTCMGPFSLCLPLYCSLPLSLSCPGVLGPVL